MKNARFAADLFVLGMVSILFLLITADKQLYDLPAVFFMTVSLVLMQRRKLRIYAFLFPFICLNRETAILLTVLFAVYFFRRLERRTYLIHVIYQLAVYIAIRLTLLWMFSDAQGTPLYFRPGENLQLYAQEFVASHMFLLLVVAVLGIVAARWRYAPELIRTAFLIFTPALAVVYICFGVSFEIRVFVELLPVVAMIAVS
jgi:hypothetical protein